MDRKKIFTELIIYAVLLVAGIIFLFTKPKAEPIVQPEPTATPIPAPTILITDEMRDDLP
ncbi:hypothetical protein LJC20_05155 [Eubacteriales bacterium OttesenSCG-928-M02]|nr:hypothetical protein [Eubacteriales bacterium OttesenSCG-928-M02]